MKVYEHIQKFQVKYCEVDFKDELKLSTLLSYFEEVACASADELGFGYSYVKPRGYAFMVSNICCEFFAPVTLGEIVRMKTWPTPPSHFVFGREYQLLSNTGKVKVNATSRWCLIDMTTGKLSPSKSIDNQDYTTYNTTKLIEDVRWKIPVFATADGEEKFRITVANSEYDHNMHVNNTRYADYCLNCFSVQELNDKRLKKCMISYIKQCKEGETLRFYRFCPGKETFVQGHNEKDELVVQAYFVFDKE